MKSVVFIAFLLDSLHRVVNLALTLAILASLLLFGSQYAHAPGIQGSWPIVRLHRLGDPITLHLAALLHLPGLKPYIPLVMAVIVYIVILVSDQVFAILHGALQALRTPVARKPIPAPAAAGVESEQAREALYKEYRKIEKTLREAQRRRCTFLSVDVVGSTGMKSGETEIAITATFRAYEELLRRTFKATHAWKESWTPDGVMICFLNREDAVKAAQTILEKLLVFNERENTLKTRFDVRCGINEGDVVIFDDSDVEKLVEHTIDVAGHMQKYARPGTLLLNRELHELLETPAGFQPAAKEVDGYQTYEWAPQP
jgi:class 3 adenylate cyclase